MGFRKVLHLFLLSASITLNAEFHIITNRQKYQKFIDTYEYTVVCFIDSKKQFVDPANKRKHKDFVADFKKSLKSASLTGPYKNLLKREVGFLCIDISNRPVSDVSDEFDFSELPYCVLLERGDVVEDALLEGFSSRPKKQTFLKFLDMYAKDDLEELVEKKEEELEQQRAERIARYQAQSHYYGWNSWGGWGPYYYDYGPYGIQPYYSPYYHPRTHVGFSFVL